MYSSSHQNTYIKINLITIFYSLLDFFARMDINLVLSFFLGICSLQVSVLAQSEAEPELGFQFPNFFNFGNSNRSVNFFLYNRESNSTPAVFHALVRRRSLLPNFRNNKPLKVVIHGWMGRDDKRFCSNIREGLLKNEDVNVITVDWSGDGSTNLLYPIARSRVPEVAATVAEFLDNLNQRYGVKLEDIHVLGHSLGAHIAGIAGYKVTTGKIGRITGLDPAGPFFSMEKPDERLSKDSAIFVDVIHTCGKFLGFDDQLDMQTSILTVENSDSLVADLTYMVLAVT
ncbi:unnamed protein product [Nezara viridula]|uniref:Lipase domain-containing protein n=1 Tax=Nezara viridula TaxID=85310 RepID=A0A9P0MWB9_NEZVI|nr:unnamed protein product [Nezara viridula]